MFAVALTGGIASGKTTVSDAFAALGVEVIDTDRISRELVAPGTPLLAQLVEIFGDGMLLPDGALNRSALRELVFRDAASRKGLEDLLHPQIRARVQERLDASKAVYCLVVIPLLAETLYPYALDRVLVVDAEPAQQLQRLQQRDGISVELANAMLAAQTSREARLTLADDVLSNTGDLTSLHDAITQLHDNYLTLAACKVKKG